MIDTKDAELLKIQTSSDLGDRVSRFTGKAFAGFAYERIRDYILDDSKQNPEYYNFQGLGKLSLSLADNPSSILWQNMHLTPLQKFHRVALGSLIVATFLVYSLIAVFFLRKLDQEHAGERTVEASVLSTAMSLFVTVTNLLLDYLIAHVVQYQRPLSVT